VYCVPAAPTNITIPLVLYDAQVAAEDEGWLERGEVSNPALPRESGKAPDVALELLSRDVAQRIGIGCEFGFELVADEGEVGVVLREAEGAVAHRLFGDRFEKRHDGDLLAFQTKLEWIRMSERHAIGLELEATRRQVDLEVALSTGKGCGWRPHRE
jgi:hypothetical protein